MPQQAGRPPDSPRPERLDTDSPALLRAPLLLMPLPWERVRASTEEVREVATEARRRLSWRRPDSFHTLEEGRGCKGRVVGKEWWGL